MDKKEYIERGALLKKIFPYGDIVDQKCYTINAKAVQKEIQDAPAADVVEVRHGEWEQQPRPYDDEIMCSVCGANYNIIDNCTEKFDYCPTCGAKMDGERKDKS